ELRSEYLLLRLVPFHCLLRRRKFARVSALQRYPTVFPLPVLFAGAWKDPVPVHRLLHPPVGCNRLKVPRFPKELNVLIEQRVPLQRQRVPLFNVRSGQQLPSEALARNVLRLLQPPEHSRTLLLSESLHPVRELLPHSGEVPKALLRLLRPLLLLLCHPRPLTASAVCLPSTDKYMIASPGLHRGFSEEVSVASPLGMPLNRWQTHRVEGINQRKNGAFDVVRKPSEYVQKPRGYGRVLPGATYLQRGECHRRKLGKIAEGLPIDCCGALHL